MANQELDINKRPSQAIEPRGESERSLITQNCRRLIMATRTQLNTPGIAEIVRTNPGIVRKVEGMVYRDPSLIKEETQAKKDLRLQAIRTEFPTVITHFSDREVMDKLLANFDNVKNRLQEQKQLLASLPNPPQVSDVELILRLMHTDAASTSLDDYFNVRASHELYGKMTDNLIDSDFGDIPAEEVEKFIKVGQRLLKNRRSLEVIPEEGDLVRHKRGEKDFEGILGIIKLRGTVISAFRESGNTDDREKARDMKVALTEWIDQMVLDYPERREVLEQLGAADYGDRSRWTEVPGQPDFTKAELQDFMHSGNG